MAEQALSTPARQGSLAIHGWLGLALIAIFWPLNWLLPGTRTAWAFFPLWLGYCLTVDAIVLRVRGTSLLTRSWRVYLGIFAISMPVWWIFEAINLRIQNWEYLGAGGYTMLGYFLLASLNFSVVMPAVFGAAELATALPFVRRLRRGPIIRPGRWTVLIFFGLGWLMLGLLIAWPRWFFPFAWLSVFFIIEPVNIWLSHHSLTEWTQRGDWRPIASLFIGVLMTGFFWEMWNYYSFPKWVYHVPGLAGSIRIFEMPLLGYGGYLPFALELYALYSLVAGFFGRRDGGIIKIHPDEEDLRP